MTSLLSSSPNFTFHTCTLPGLRAHAHVCVCVCVCVRVCVLGFISAAVKRMQGCNLSMSSVSNPRCVRAYRYLDFGLLVSVLDPHHTPVVSLQKFGCSSFDVCNTASRHQGFQTITLAHVMFCLKNCLTKLNLFEPFSKFFGATPPFELAALRAHLLYSRAAVRSAITNLPWWKARPLVVLSGSRSGYGIRTRVRLLVSWIT